MKPIQSAPLLASLAPVAASAPPVLILAAVCLGLYLLLSGDKEEPTAPVRPDAPRPESPTEEPADVPPHHAAPQKAAPRRITQEDVAEAFAYGARTVTRHEAVAVLQMLGFG